MYLIFLPRVFYREHHEDKIDDDDPYDSIHDGFLLTVCSLGIIFNWLSLLVLANKEQKLPIFLYLTVYTSLDLLYTIILFGDILVGGYLRCNGLAEAMQFLEFFGGEVINTVRIIVVLAITLDRLSHMKKILAFRNTRGKKVRSHAVWIMVVTFLITIIANLPNILAYTGGDPYADQESFFSHSRFYYSYNWIYFSVFNAIPCFLLVVGNIRLIKLLRRAMRRENIRSKVGRKINFTLTIAATITIVIFVVIQLPGYIIKKIHFGSMISDEVQEESIETLNDFYIFIPATNSFGNFFVYTFLCPPFRRVLVKIVKKRKIRVCG